MAALKLLVAAAIAYVLVRAGWIFGGAIGLAGVAVVLAFATFAASRRQAWAVAAGPPLGAAVSAVALTV